MDPIPPHSYVVVPRGSNEATNEPDGWVRDSSQSLLNAHTLVRYHDTTILRTNRTEERRGDFQGRFTILTECPYKYGSTCSMKEIARGANARSGGLGWVFYYYP